MFRCTTQLTDFNQQNSRAIINTLLLQVGSTLTFNASQNLIVISQCVEKDDDQIFISDVPQKVSLSDLFLGCPSFVEQSETLPS